MPHNPVHTGGGDSTVERANDIPEGISGPRDPSARSQDTDITVGGTTGGTTHTHAPSTSTVASTSTGGTGEVPHGIPEPDEAEFWLVDGVYYVVYMVPDSKPPIPMAWAYEDLKSLKVDMPNPKITKMTGAEADKRGWTLWGKRIELVNTTEHPFNAFVSLINDQAAVRPWLRDLEVLTLIAQATLEGRAVSDAEFEQTQWWRSRRPSERAWLLLAEADPQEAARILEDNKFQAEADLFSAGIIDASPELISYMASQTTMGIWSQEYYDRQLKAISDPNLGYEIDEDMLEAMGGFLNIGTNQQFEDTVRALVDTWLGPVMGNWSDADVSRWASRFRETPDGRAELEQELVRQRLALFPEYEDPTLTYENIASPWRAKWSQMWGQTADETDPLFGEIIRLNNATAAGRRLTQEGLNRGIRKVRQEAQLAMDQSFRNNAGVVPGPR